MGRPRVRKSVSRGQLVSTGRRAPLAKSLTEKAIQSSILGWLRRSGYMHWRQNAGLLKQGPRRIRLGPKGVPDIIVVIPPDGRFVGLEVKSAVGRQSPHQKTFESKLRSVGASYFLVRSLKEAKEAIWSLRSGNMRA